MEGILRWMKARIVPLVAVACFLAPAMAACGDSGPPTITAGSLKAAKPAADCSDPAMVAWNVVVHGVEPQDHRMRAKSVVLDAQGDEQGTDRDYDVQRVSNSHNGLIVVTVPTGQHRGLRITDATAGKTSSMLAFDNPCVNTLMLGDVMAVLLPLPAPESCQTVAGRPGYGVWTVLLRNLVAPGAANGTRTVGVLQDGTSKGSIHLEPDVARAFKVFVDPNVSPAVKSSSTVAVKATTSGAAAVTKSFGVLHNPCAVPPK
jgi:hypothetical protein